MCDRIVSINLKRGLSLLIASILASALLLVVPASDSSAQNLAQESTSEENGPVAVDEEGRLYAEGELIVLYEKNQKAVTEDPNEGEVAETVPEIGMQLVEFSEVKAEEDEDQRAELLEDKEEELERDADVAAVQPNYLMKPDWIPNDTMFKRHRYNQQDSLPVVKAPQAWNINRGRGARIVVIDTGIYANHPDIKGKVVGARNVVNDTSNVYDTWGHGTHVASIAAANTNDGQGIAGAAPSSRLLIAKASRPDGLIPVAAEIKAIRWGANRGGDVINMSFGTPYNTGPAVQRAINYARSKGALPVASAGNLARGQKPRANYPASYNGVVAVGSVNGWRKKSWFSNSGAHVDLVAPGQAVQGAYKAKGWAGISGTSQSAPHVAALAALLESQAPARGPVAKEKLMKRTAKDMGAAGRDNQYGHGRVNFESALRSGR